MYPSTTIFFCFFVQLVKMAVQYNNSQTGLTHTFFLRNSNLLRTVRRLNCAKEKGAPQKHDSTGTIMSSVFCKKGHL